MNEKRTGKCCSINIHEIYFMVHTLNIFYCQTIIQTMEQTQVINLQGLYVHENYICNNFFKTFDFWYLTPLSAIFQLYHGDQF
jgi:hypothetical protein